MKDEINSPEQITAAEQIEMAPQGLFPGPVNPTPPPRPTPHILLDFRIGDLLGLQCDWRPAQGLGHVLHISVNRRQTGPFGRATSGQDPTQGAFRLWCNVPNGRWFSLDHGVPIRQYPGPGHWSPILGLISHPEDPYYNTNGVFWMPPPGFRSDPTHPEFVCDLIAYENGHARYEANWIDQGNRPAAFKRIEPHWQVPNKRILVVGP